MRRAFWGAILLAGCTAQQTCGLGGACDWNAESLFGADAGTVSVTSAEVDVEDAPREQQNGTPSVIVEVVPIATDDRGNLAPVSRSAPPAIASYVDAGLEGETSSTTAPSAAPPGTAPAVAVVPTKERDEEEDNRRPAVRRPAPTSSAPPVNPLTDGVDALMKESDLPRGYVLSDAGAGPF